MPALPPDAQLLQLMLGMFVSRAIGVAAALGVADERCISLLANCRRAMAPGGRVLIIESVLSDAPESTITKLIDLYAVYAPPTPYLSFVVSLEQSGNVVRYGEPPLYFIHRDQTELALHLVVTY